MADLPGIEVKAERVAAHATAWTMPCLRITARDFEVVDTALAADSSIGAITDGTAFTDKNFYQVEWTDAGDERIAPDCLVEYSIT